ncbi:MAG: PepSY domain-containing protein [Cellvibrionaceae bacterium]|nr:PepSY domain-containing protein [Cellvibrionaceae bacterium]
MHKPLECAVSPNNRYRMKITPKLRQSWMQWHAYIGCFFLPFIVLFSITGTLYLLDVKGSNSEELRFSITGEAWPEDQASAQTFVLQQLHEKDSTIEVTSLPDNYFSSASRHSWFGYNYSTALSKTNKPNEPFTIEFNRHGLWKKILYIHFGLAGPIFKILGIIFGLCLLFSAISGLLLLLSSSRYKAMAITGIASSSLILFLAYLIS